MKKIQQIYIDITFEKYKYIEKFLKYLNCKFNNSINNIKDTNKGFLIYNYNDEQNLIGFNNSIENDIYNAQTIDNFLNIISQQNKVHFNFYKNIIVDNWYTIKTKNENTITNWLILYDNNCNEYECYPINSKNEYNRYFNYIKKYYEILEIRKNSNNNNIFDGEIIYTNNYNVKSYSDIMRNLFYKKETYYLNDNGYITTDYVGLYYMNDFNFKTYNQLEKIISLNKLYNCSIYFNDGWEPNWTDFSEPKYYICYDNANNVYKVSKTYSENNGAIYFESKKAALKTIEILGNDTLKYCLK